MQVYVVHHHPNKFGDHRHSDSYKKKFFIKNMNLIDTYYHCKIELIGYPIGKKNTSQLKNVCFERKGPEVKKLIFSLHDYLL